jgi:hypothetical protein
MELFMAMLSCPKGHWFDTAENATCPYCNNAAADAGATVPVIPEDRVGVTLPVLPEDRVGVTLPVMPEDRVGVTLPVMPEDRASNGKTMPLMRENSGIDPVVGWLVCTSGKDKGKDYKIHADNNYIGKSQKMDICILGDETISFENHAIISYDTRDKIFYLAPASGRAIIRHNGKPALTAVELASYDDIEIGNTKLKFIPFCGEKFDWSDV